ncbi:type II toxin-antitoxin system prevent-host-death family antitoxin [Acerihabitans arboris]|uniref:Antitoxin n=1 Tax=Acerihabitans arboris TaxID=2691583 RepID=A0A845SJ77_9GAMM|nr:type II toxin-antitoxin system prevent-host-death family antitoxin [Acerihabitans arboris]NDL63422.1 type II toxin-antitoxin system prevent-host-death family antitoxin [Acerihabitans arboris]
MITELLNFDELPQANASQVKNKWGEVVRLVHQAGTLAITNHSTVEMVLLDVATYRELTESILLLKAREQSVLDELTARFNARLAVLERPDAAKNVASVLAQRGTLKRRPKAGESF